jgi:hypothetical protein
MLEVYYRYLPTFKVSKIKHKTTVVDSSDDEGVRIE